LDRRDEIDEACRLVLEMYCENIKVIVAAELVLLGGNRIE
jgi:hypothetical protein